MDHLAGLIAHEFARAERNLRSLLRAHPHGEDTNTGRTRLSRRLQAVGIKFFPVRNNNNRPRKSLRFAEGFLTGTDGGRNVGSALGYEVRVELVHRSQHRTMV